MERVQDTLVQLEIENDQYHHRHTSDEESLRQYLPRAMPKLKSLKLDGVVCKFGQLFLENLKDSRQLEYIFLTANCSIQEEGLKALKKAIVGEEITATLDISVELRTAAWYKWPWSNAALTFDNSPKFKIMDFFPKEVKRLYLEIDEWTPQHTTALEHFVGECDTVDSLNIYQDTDSKNGFVGMNAALTQFFKTNVELTSFAS